MSDWTSDANDALTLSLGMLRLNTQRHADIDTLNINSSQIPERPGGSGRRGNLRKIPPKLYVSGMACFQACVALDEHPSPRFMAKTKRYMDTKILPSM